MTVVCLDLEGVLVPEIWIALAERVGIEELRLTTRDVPDYDRLMRGRLRILEHHAIGLPDIQSAIAEMEPLDGAREFLDRLRELTQVVILSDTFVQFAAPLLRQLGRPTLFCNDLVVNDDGRILDYRLRQPEGKLRAVEGLRSMNLHVIAGGDSYNDLSMIRAANEGFLFRPPAQIRTEESDLPVFDDYDPLYAHLEGHCARAAERVGEER